MKTLRSLRVILASVGSRGDVQPMLALAQALRASGHVPVIAAPPNVESWVRQLGFEFAPLGVDIQQWLAEHSDIMTGNPVTMLKGASQYLNEQIPEQAHELMPICAGADALVYAGLALAAPTVADYLHLPTLGVLYTTCMLPSGRHPPMSIPWHGLPHWINHLLWQLNNLLGDRLGRKTLNTVRTNLNLPEFKHIRSHFFVDHSIIIAADEALFPADSLWQARYPYANFLYFDDPAALDPELNDWLAGGEAPVFVGFGSMSGKGTQRIERLMVEAIGATGRRCIVGAGWASFGASALPSGWRMVRNVPHALLFPRMAVVIHHGGSGTTAQALRAGVPQVLLPLLLDQFHHAHRLYLAGIAPRPVPMEKITAAELTNAIQTALQLPAGPRQAAATRLRQSDGRGDIVRRVEAMVGANK